MFRTSAAIFAGSIALLVVISAGARQPKRDACPDGLFLINGTPFTDVDGDAITGVISLQAGEIRIENACENGVEAKVRATRLFDTVKGKWDACAPFPSKVKLKAKLDAESCQTIEGALRVKKLKPKKQPFTATRLSPEALALIEVLGSEEVELRMQDENFPFVIHPAAEFLNPELVELIALGADAVPATVAEFRREANLAKETHLSLLAVALERLGDSWAVPALADWLEANLFTANLTWAPHLVTHALKVLDGQGGLATELFIYDVDEMLEAVALARLGGAPSPVFRARSLDAGARTDARAPGPRTTLRESNLCQAKIIVTGIDDFGQTGSLSVPYQLHDKDIQQQIDEEPPGPALAKMVNRLLNWRTRDEDVYGGSDYVPIDPDGDVSLRSNCGGTVLERMLNEVARINGYPIRLGRGTSSANNARDVALTFGSASSFEDLEPLLTMVSHEDDSRRSLHVEIPTHRLDPDSLVIFSKDVQGKERQHVVDNNLESNWERVTSRYGFKPFNNSAVTTRYARIDPSRILDIRVDMSACPCRFRTGIDVDLVEPAEGDVDALTVTVAGTVSAAPDSTGNLRLNGRFVKTLDPVGDAFSTELDLRVGENQLRTSFVASDGRRGCVERKVIAPCEFSDPNDPFNGGGRVRFSSDGGPIVEWPGYSAFSIRSNAGAVVWFGAPPFSEPHILFELYGKAAVKPGTFEVRERPTSDDAFQRDFAVGRIREHAAAPGMFQKDDLIAGTLTVDEFQKGKERLLVGHFDVTARSDEDGTTRRVVGRFDLCRFGIERSNGISLAKSR